MHGNMLHSKIHWMTLYSADGQNKNCVCVQNYMDLAVQSH